METYTGLVAEEAVYHRICYQKFLSNEGESNPVDRSFNDDSNNAFHKLCLRLKSEAGTNLLTLDELQEQMEEFSESNEVYSTNWLKKKLKDRYSNHLCFVESKSRKNILCFKNMANYIVNGKWYEKDK